MQQLGVFGGSADEFLAFASANKEQWAMSGAEVVQGMVEIYSWWREKYHFPRGSRSSNFDYLFH
jgi:hypothetical protein